MILILEVFTIDVPSYAQKTAQHRLFQQESSSLGTDYVQVISCINFEKKEKKKV